MKLYKVWSLDRTKKSFISINEENTPSSMYTDLILQASAKLGINGSILVLESDGTEVDESVLPLLDHSSTTLMLLQPGETWSPANLNSTSTSSLATTVTYQDSAKSVSTVQSAPISLQEPTLFYTIDCNSEMLWESFEIPYYKMPNHMISHCEAGKRDKQVITDMVHIIVNELRTINTIIPLKSMKIIAKKLTQKYPGTFQDVDEDGVVIGDGCQSLLLKLVDRNNYLNRPHKRKSDSQTECPVLHKKRQLNKRAGCSNWAPPVTDCIEQNTVDYKIMMNANSEDFNTLMETTYPQQRMFINNVNPPTVQQIKQEWPVLFSPRGIKYHFKKLTGADVDCLSQQFIEKGEKIIQLAKKNKIDASTETFTYEENILRLIANHFKEEYREILYECENFELLNIQEIPLTPIIIKSTATGQYQIYIERENFNVNVTLNEFIEAIKLTFCFYFNFNMNYPKKMQTSLEVLQRYFLKIHPDAGSKAKKPSVTKKKVITYMNMLNKL